MSQKDDGETEALGDRLADWETEGLTLADGDRDGEPDMLGETDELGD